MTPTEKLEKIKQAFDTLEWACDRVAGGKDFYINGDRLDEIARLCDSEVRFNEGRCTECFGDNMTDDPDESRCVECIQAAAEMAGELAMNR